VAGITGATITAGNAYIADISTPANRAQNFGLVGLAFGLGFITGPALGGLLGAIGLRVPFFVAAGIVLANWLYGMFVLPESLPKERRRPFAWRRANPVGGLLALRRYPIVASLAFAFVFLMLAQRGLESVWVLYTSYRFDWNPLQNGTALALAGIGAAVVQGFLVRIVVRRLGERRSVVVGLSIGVVGYALYGFASSGAFMYVAIAFGSLGGIAGPAIQGLIAGAAPSEEQGSVQGSLASLMSLTAIVAPLLSANLFGLFSGEGAVAEIPGMPFFAGSLYVLAALAVVARALRLHQGEPAVTRTETASP
jgi:DHA1 family tetracycline resistance protein-like MFS transporter